MKERFETDTIFLFNENGDKKIITPGTPKTKKKIRKLIFLPKQDISFLHKQTFPQAGWLFDSQFTVEDLFSTSYIYNCF